MPKTANVYARIEPELKEQAENILDLLGISASNAITMFYRQIVLQRRLPFDVKLPEPRVPDVRKMSDGELELALASGLRDVDEGRTRDAEEVFADLRGKYGGRDAETQPTEQTDRKK